MAKRKVIGYRVIDVGRPGHHYVRVAVLEPRGKGKGVRKGTTVGKLITKKQLQAQIKKARRKWMRMSPTARKRAMPERKGRRGYKKKLVTMRHWKTGKRFKRVVWVKRK